MICVLAGGVGAARFLTGLVRVTEPEQIAVIANVGDDTILHGLHVSPDLDTLVYTLADAINPETGWGRRGETWNAMASLEHYGGETWFRLGDLDLGTHLYRTARLGQGATLGEVTAEIARAWELALDILPVTDDRLSTMVSRPDGTEISFQDYFVRLAHDVEVTAVRFDGADQARPGPGVLDTLARAETIVIAPSNPLVSIGPLLAVADVADSIASRRRSTVAISPIVAGAAIKGPAANMMRELGHEASALGVARLYRDLAGAMIIDQADAGLAEAIEDLGMQIVVTDTIMSDPSVAADLALTALHAAGGTP